MASSAAVFMKDMVSSGRCWKRGQQGRCSNKSELIGRVMMHPPSLGLGQDQQLPGQVAEGTGGRLDKLMTCMPVSLPTGHDTT